MRTFSHAIITRFNIATDYSFSTRLDSSWLNYRFNLFDQFCYPSVLGQSNQNFIWIVLFDIRTPDAYKDKITEYSVWKSFIPVYVDGLITDNVKQEIISKYLIKKDTEYLITTRLDNDDAIAKHFVQTIQNSFKAQECEFINLSHGYCLYNKEIFLVKNIGNPFISLIERVDRSLVKDIKTVYCGTHNELSAIGPVVQIEIEPAWIQVIHQGNVLNTLRGVKQSIEGLDNNFAIDLELLQQQSPLSMVANQGFHSFRVVRKAFAKVKKKILNKR